MSDGKGFLTQTDREFLRGEKEYTGDNAKQMRYQRRRAIRERTRAAFQDFSLLFETLDKSERDKIFDVGKDSMDHDALTDFRESLASTIAFIYLSLEGEAGSGPIWDRSFRTPFKAILNKAVSKAEIKRHTQNEVFQTIVDVKFGVDVKQPDITDIDSAVNKIARYKEYELSETELRSIIYNTNRMMKGGLHELADRVEHQREEIEAEEDIEFLLSPTHERDEE